MTLTKVYPTLKCNPYHGPCEGGSMLKKSGGILKRVSRLKFSTKMESSQEIEINKYMITHPNIGRTNSLTKSNQNNTTAAAYADSTLYHGGNVCVDNKSEVKQYTLMIDGNDSNTCSNNCVTLKKSEYKDQQNLLCASSQDTTHARSLRRVKFLSGTSDSSSVKQSNSRNIIVSSTGGAEEVFSVPSRETYTIEQRNNLWYSCIELQHMIWRNTLEYNWEKGDWRSAVEENAFCTYNGKLIHPAHLPYNYPISNDGVTKSNGIQSQDGTKNDPYSWLKGRLESTFAGSSSNLLVLLASPPSSQTIQNANEDISNPK